MEKENRDMDARVELRVAGITRNPIQSGAYALLLEEVGGPYRIPIVVGVAEAQSIAMRLENVITPRPHTHDLFTSMFHAFGIELVSVTIYHFADGVFSAKLHLTCNGENADIDARTSDAVAIALRTSAPIFTTREILQLTGYIPGSDGEPLRQVSDTPLDQLPIERLQERLQHYVDSEQYEKAADVQKIIASKMRNSGNI